MQTAIIALFIFALIANACFIQGPNTILTKDIYDAENILFASNGRLFVSGGDNFYEIVNKTSKVPLFDYKLQLYTLGIVEYQKYIITVDNKGTLWCSNDTIAAMNFSMRKLYTIPNVSLPNGMAIGKNDILYVADTAMNHPIRGGQIVQIQFAYQHGVVVVLQCHLNWLAAPAIKHPNGIRFKDDALLVTDTNRLLRIGIDTNNRPTTVDTVYSQSVIYLDDLNIINMRGHEYVLVADYLYSTLIVLAYDGTVIPPKFTFVNETQRMMFAAPSSLAQGQPPMFTDTDILVTNKGIVQSHVQWGNFLSQVKLSDC